MKILKFLLLLIVGLILFCLLIGMIKPSVQYGHIIQVNKPIQEAWAVSQDESKYKQWLEGYKSMELISGEPFAVGSKYKVIVDPGEGQEDIEMIETVISVKENDHVTLHFDSAMMDFEQTISFTEANGKTTVTSDSKVIGKNLVMRSMFALMEMFTGSFTKQEAKNFDKLKTLIEENRTVY